MSYACAYSWRRQYFACVQINTRSFAQHCFAAIRGDSIQTPLFKCVMTLMSLVLGLWLQLVVSPTMRSVAIIPWRSG